MGILKGFTTTRFLFVLQTLLLALIMTIGSWYVVMHQKESMENQVFETVQMMSTFGAKAVSRILEEAVDNGVFPVGDVMDTNYNMIEGLDPPKYHTKYDFYTDKALVGLQDELLEDKHVKYAVAIDINGYVPTHNIRYQKSITYDYEKDKKGNKTKRIYHDEISHKAARNLKKGYRQVFYQEEGKEMWDVATPIHVKGRHWGNFRVGYALEDFHKAKESLIHSMILIMVIIWFVSVLFLYISLKLTFRSSQEKTALAKR